VTFRRRVLAHYQVVSDFKTSLTRFVGQGHPGDKVDHVLKAFKRLRDQQKIKDAKQKDIDQWKDFEALQDFVDKLDSESTVSRKLGGQKTDGAELIAENEGWRVYKILNHQACMRYGDDTQWCIKKPDGQQWRDYSADNDFYFFIAKKRPPGDRWFKIAMKVEPDGTRAYWDAEDQPREGAAKVPTSLGLPTIEVENAPQKITIDGQRVPLDQFALMGDLTVKGDLDLRHTNIQQLPAGLTVGRNLDLCHTNIQQLPAGLTVGGHLYLSGTPIKLLPAGLTVKGGLWLDNTPIKELPTGLTVGGHLWIQGSPIQQLPPDLQVKGTIFTDSRFFRPLDPGKFSRQVEFYQ